jgi:hypothetical protein
VKAVQRVGSIPTKRVRVEGITPDDTDDEILECALRYAGETRSSLFGWRVERYDDEGVASVALHTD